MEQKSRMDKTAFEATNAEEANNHVKDWEDKTYSGTTGGSMVSYTTCLWH